MIGYLSVLMIVSASVNLYSGIFFLLLFWRVRRKKTGEKIFHYFLFGFVTIFNCIFLLSFAVLLNRDVNLTTRGIAHRLVVIAVTFMVAILIYFYKTYFKQTNKLDIYIFYFTTAFFSLLAVINNRFFLFKEPQRVSAYYIGLKHGFGFRIWAIYILTAASYSLLVTVGSMFKKWKEGRRLPGSIMIVSFAHAIWLTTGFFDALTAIQIFNLPPLTWGGSFFATSAVGWMLIVEIDDSYREKNQYYEKMIHDPLTGAYDRSYFEVRLSSLPDELKKKPTQGYIAILDLDGLKIINDSLGHSHGDLALASTVKSFRSIIRKSTDIIARYGGDEFMIMVTRFTAKNEIAKLTSRFEKVMNNLHYVYKGKRYPISCSVGITYFDESYRDIPELNKLLLARADEALYESKKQGKNVVTFLEMPKLQQGKEVKEKVVVG